MFESKSNTGNLLNEARNKNISSVVNEASLSGIEFGNDDDIHPTKFKPLTTSLKKNKVKMEVEKEEGDHGYPEVKLTGKRKDIESSEQVEITHINLNDQTVEGIRIKNKKAFSVQYHPESSPGPHDSRYLFEQFEDLMNE